LFFFSKVSAPCWSTKAAFFQFGGAPGGPCCRPRRAIGRIRMAKTPGESVSSANCKRASRPSNINVACGLARGLPRWHPIAAGGQLTRTRIRPFELRAARPEPVAPGAGSPSMIAPSHPGAPNSAGRLLTILTVSMLTRATWPTRRTMYSGSSARFGSERRRLRLSSLT